MTQLQGKLDAPWSLMQEVKVPMVVTHDGDNGRMRARPMAAHLDPDSNAIFLLTDAQAAKDKGYRSERQRMPGVLRHPKTALCVADRPRRIVRRQGKNKAVLVEP